MDPDKIDEAKSEYARLIAMTYKQLEAYTGKRIPHAHLAREGVIIAYMAERYGDDWIDHVTP